MESDVLQQCFDEEVGHLRAQTGKLVEYTQRQFQCRICMEDQPDDFVARLDPCGHSFCRTCIKDYIGAKIEEHHFPVLCPVCMTKRHGGHPTSAQMIFFLRKQQYLPGA